MTLDEAFEFWMDVHVARVRATTIKAHRSTYRVHISPVFGAQEITNITSAMVSRAFVDLWRPALGKGVLFSLKKTFHALLNFLVEEAFIGKNPARRIHTDKRFGNIQILTEAQLRQLLEHAKGHKIYPALLLLSMSGMRISELCGLQWPDMDFTRRTIRICRTFYDGEEHDTKTRASRRTISLPESVVSVLTAHKKDMTTQYPGHKWMFPTKNLKPRSRLNVRYNVVKLLDELGLPRVRLHSFRHAHATYLLEAGVSIKAIQDRLGWSTASMLLERYAHVTQNETQKTVAILNSFLT